MAAPQPNTSSSDHYHHAPHQTELAKALNRTGETVKPYGKLILILGLALAVVVAGGLIWRYSTNAIRSAAWEEFAQATTPDDFVKLAEKYPGTSIANWSRLQAGRLFVNEGLGVAFTNRSLSDEQLNKAKDQFNMLVGSTVEDSIREETLYGLATCLESLSNGDDQLAIDAYERLLKEFPRSQHSLWANERIKVLKTKNASEFYAWFRQQNPKPVERTGPRDLSTTPPLGDLSGFSFPLGGDTLPPSGSALIPESTTTPGSTAPEIPQIPSIPPESPGATAPPVPAGDQPPPSSESSAAPTAPAPVPSADQPAPPAEQPSENKPAAPSPVPNSTP